MRLRIITYNIHKGRDWLGRRNILADIKKALRELEVDICFLQEVQGGIRLDGDFETQFEFLADEVWPHFSYGKNAVFPDRHHGNAILSKYPIRSYSNTDLSTNRWERRGLLHGHIEIPGRPHGLQLLNTHLNLTEGGRNEQSDQIAEYVLAQIPSSEPVILAGDLNDWNGRISKRLMSKINFSEVSFAHRNRVATFPSFFPVFHLDRLFYRGLELKDRDILDFKPWKDLSDHLPLFAEFGLEENS